MKWGKWGGKKAKRNRKPSALDIFLKTNFLSKHKLNYRHYPLLLNLSRSVCFSTFSESLSNAIV